jgi:hypothetical protein
MYALDEAASAFARFTPMSIPDRYWLAPYSIMKNIPRPSISIYRPGDLQTTGQPDTNLSMSGWAFPLSGYWFIVCH